MTRTDLAKLFVTKNEAADFANELSQVIQNVYQAGFSLEKSLAYQFGSEKKDVIMDILRNEQIEWQNNAILTKYLTAWQEKIMKLPTMTLTLAFLPKSDSLYKISDWIYLNTDETIVIEINTDPCLIGGALINFKGKYYDGSIKTRFLEVVYGSKL